MTESVYTTQVRHHNRPALCTCCACFPQNVIIICQYLPRIGSVDPPIACCCPYTLPTFTKSSPLHHRSYRCLSVLICLQALVSSSSCFCTSFSAAPLHIASPTISFKNDDFYKLIPSPCLATRFFPRCSMCPLAPFFACLRIWNSLIHQNVDSLIRWVSSTRFHWLWPRRVLLPLQSSFTVSRWLLPEYPHQVPPPTLPFHLHQSTYWLPSTMIGCHTNTGGGCVCACIRAYTQTAWVLVVSPGVGRTPKRQKNPDRLKRSIHVDRIGVQSTFVYIYAGLRVLMIWANCFFLSTCLFF